MTARRMWGVPLSPVYGAVVRLKRKLLNWGVMKQRRLVHPVISVGSLSAGGAGKTPVVLMLARSLSQRGYAPRILTRGYGRKSHGVERVVPGGDPAWFGDEPMLLAERSGVPVFVGTDRYAAGLLAERDAGEDKVIVHLLDDGFQHLKLARDVEIVLLTREDVQDELLPAGNLREPLEALTSADVVILRQEELACMDAVAVRMAKAGAAATTMWVVQRRLRFREEEPLPVRPVVFCGIARPEGFFEMLRDLGCEAADWVTFEDHHEYVEDDLQRLLDTARRCSADGFVTTEKDAVKISEAHLKVLEEAGSMVVARLDLELMDEKQAIDDLIAKVRPMERRRRV